MQADVLGYMYSFAAAGMTMLDCSWGASPHKGLSSFTMLSHRPISKSSDMWVC